MSIEINNKLSDRLAQTLIGDAGTAAGVYAKFPKQSSNLVALCAASWAVGIGHSVAFADGDAIPVECYFMAEGKSGEGKSRVLNSLTKGFSAAIDEQEMERKKIRMEALNAHAENNDGKKVVNPIEAELMEKQLIENHPISHGATDLNSASMDVMLKEQMGWFCLKSSELGIVDSLFLGSHTDGASNIDALLNGFDANHTETRRVGRSGFKGIPHGGVGVFGQEGTIEKIMLASGDRGLTQRFFMMSEPGLMGFRNFKRENVKPKSVEQFNDKCYKITTNAIKATQKLTFDSLSVIRLSDESWDNIYEFKNEIEPMLRPGEKYHASIISSMWSKFEMFVMKVAATLHIFNGKTHLVEVDLSTTMDAVMIADCLLSGVSRIAEEKGIIGDNTEERVILEYLENKARIRGLDMTYIKNTMTRRKVFNEYGREKGARIEFLVNSLCGKGKVRSDNINGTEMYKFVKF